MFHKLRTREAAAMLGVSASYLNQLRVKGGGPQYSKIGKRIVVYEVADLRDWANTETRRSTGPKNSARGIDKSVTLARTKAPRIKTDRKPYPRRATGSHHR